MRIENARGLGYGSAGMRKGEIRRWVLLGWAGLAGAAAGREVPVHREYTKPVVMYDETGARTAWGGEVPDLEAMSFVRESKALEGLVGKETLFTLSFERGGPVLTRGEGMRMAAPAASGGSRRENRSSGDPNWLARSLAMPSLGQNVSNAAVSAMSIDGAGSGWGWLADELGSAALGMEPVPEWPAAGEAEPSAERDLLRDSNVFSPSRGEGQPTDRAGTWSSADPVPEGSLAGAGAGGWPAGRANESREGAKWGEDRRSTAPRFLLPAGTGEGLKQTRQMMADLTQTVRPGLEAMKTMGGESLSYGRTGGSALLAGSPAEGGGTGAEAVGGGGWSGWKGSSPSRSGALSGLSSAGGSWQGGWNLPAGGLAGAGGGSRLPSSVAGAGVETPAPAQGKAGMVPHGRAYQPAWR